MQTGKDETGGARSPTLADFIRSTDRKHRPKVDAVRQVGDLPQHTPRQIERVPLARLTASNSNPRTHSQKQVRQIAASIRRFGFTVPVLVNAQNEILAGHGRVEAAKLLGLTQVPVLRLNHLSAAEQRAYIIADNRLAELADWNRETLAIELQGLIELDFDIAVTGFEIGEIDLILQHDEADEEGTEKTGAEAKTAKSRAVQRSVGAATCGSLERTGSPAVIHLTKMAMSPSMPQFATGRSRPAFQPRLAPARHSKRSHKSAARSAAPPGQWRLHRARGRRDGIEEAKTPTHR